jgi:hypothetical protein
LLEVLLSKTQFSQRYNVLGGPASNTDGFLYEHTCVWSIELIFLFRTK